MRLSELADGYPSISSWVAGEMSGDNAPCFTERLSTIDDLDVRDILRYIQEAKKLAERGVLMFSVTEQEPNYKEWVKQGLSFAGATCTVGRSKRHGDYKCFFINIPVEHRFRSYKECL